MSPKDVTCIKEKEEEMITKKDKINSVDTTFSSVEKSYHNCKIILINLLWSHLITVIMQKIFLTPLHIKAPILCTVQVATCTMGLNNYFPLPGPYGKSPEVSSTSALKS